jgi:hypothetical protein
MFMNTRQTPLMTLVALAWALCSAAEPRTINIPPGDLATALEIIAQQGDVELVFQPDQLKGLHTDGVVGMMTARQAAEKLLEGTGLQLRADPGNGAMMVGTAAGAARPEEEVLVSARRAELRAMREEIENLRARFYTEYNRLNSNHWWDVICRSPRAPNDRRGSRICRPRYLDQGMSHVPGAAGATDGIRPPPSYVATPVPANDATARKKWAEFEKNLQNQINRSAELRRLLSEREALEKRYEDARR